ncbi:MAG: efflux RND transporter periplasmic adaptor subunit, partial [Planctomycetota bacterium]|nr:efflux RND transporter periplasmic adaptor subunit [Planctomycetota bacterium]
MKKLVIVLVIVLLIIGGVVLVVKRVKGAKAVDNNNKEKVIPVVVSEVQKTSLLETTTCFGTVKAIKQVDVYSKVSGRVEKMIVRTGEKVTAGQILLVVEHSLIKAQMEQSQASREMAQAQLKQIEINLSNLEKELARITNLSKEGAVSESRKDQIETQYKTALAQKEATLAQIKQLDAVIQQAKIQGDEAHIKAPISGVISQKEVEIGDMVTSQRPVFTIIQDEVVKVSTTIPEIMVGRIHTARTPYGAPP